MTAAPAARRLPEAEILVTVALGAMVVPLNSTMIAVALPRLIDDFHSRLTVAGWLVTGYLIAMASLSPVTGNLGDRLGRRPLILAGLTWFAAASLAAGFAQDLGWLIAFRIQQAVAGALVFPNGIALLREIAPPGQLGRRLGLIMGTLPLAAAIGPLLAGVLLAVAGWRAIFFVNVPLLVLPLFLGWRSLPRGRSAKPHGRLDLVGGVLLSLLLVAAAWTINRGLGTVDGLAALIVAALAAVLFAVQELRHATPILELRLFRNSQFVAANGGVALSNLAMYVTLFTLPILLGRTTGWTGARVGLVVATMTMTMTMFASSPVGGRLADRLGARLPAALGLVLTTLCLVPLAVAPSGIPGPGLIAALVGIGGGIGLATVPLQLAALDAVDASKTGLASGMFSTSRYLGSIVGISLLAGPLAPAATGFGGFAALFVFVTGASAASAALALLLPGSLRSHGARSARRRITPRSALRGSD